MSAQMTQNPSPAAATDNPPLIEAARSGDLDRARVLLEADSSCIEQLGQQDWSALAFAAGAGHLPMVELLLERGAEVSAMGIDRRTPRMIARAAGHADVFRLLRQEEERRGVAPAADTEQPYSKAYSLRDLRRFDGWSESRENWVINEYWLDDVKADFERPLQDDDVVFLHQDHSVTRSMWHNEHVIFAENSAEWTAYCKTELRFSVPSSQA